MDRIVSDPAIIMRGVPCVRATRIPVTTIAGLLAENVSVADVLDSYPTLTIDDVRALPGVRRRAGQAVTARGVTHVARLDIRADSRGQRGGWPADAWVDR